MIRFGFGWGVCRVRDSSEDCPKAVDVKAEAGRVASLLVALACLAIAYFFGSSEVFHLSVAVVVLPLGCIWYGTEIGSFVGMSANGESETGSFFGVLVALVGWVALFAMLASIVFLSF
ncbi:MAG: hypothetical protein U0997_11320 [Sulfurimicrobium sp.]|nr:hypothetical protein [Sulfurimicrobium sp.]